MINLKIIAHRGNDNSHRENSFESIINSLNQSFVDGVEFDIRKTKDNKFIINHDPFYRQFFIKDTNCNVLRKLGLNTLEEILDNVTNKKILLIEVKIEKDIKTTSKYLFDILKKYNLNIYICSFNYEFISYFHKKYKIKSGLIIGSKVNVNYLNNSLDFNSISYKYKGNIPNKETFIWTVNNVDDIKGENIITDNPKKIYNYVKKIV